MPTAHHGGPASTPAAPAIPRWSQGSFGIKDESGPCIMEAGRRKQPRAVNNLTWYPTGEMKSLTFLKVRGGFRSLEKKSDQMQHRKALIGNRRQLRIGLVDLEENQL